MLVVVWENLLHEFLFALGHCLDDETPVVAEKEETATRAGSLSGRKNLVAIGLGVK